MPSAPIATNGSNGASSPGSETPAVTPVATVTGCCQAPSAPRWTARINIGLPASEEVSIHASTAAPLAATASRGATTRPPVTDGKATCSAGVVPLPAPGSRA